MRFAATCLNILGLASCSASCFWHLKDTCCAPQQEDCKNIRQNVPLNLCEDKFRHSSASDKEGGFEMLPWGDPWHDGHMLEAWGYICRHTVTKTPYSWESTLSCERLCSIEKNVAMSLRVVVCNHDSHCLTSFLAQKLGAKRAQNRAKRAQYPAKRAQNQKVYRPMP